MFYCDNTLVWDGFIAPGGVKYQSEICDEEGNITPAMVCCEMIDCAGRIDHLIIRQKFTFGTTTPIQNMINTIYNHISSFGPMPTTLGYIYAPGFANQDTTFEIGTSLLEIFKDLAKKVNGEFRVCNCKIDFAVPDLVNPYGVGILMPDNYIYNDTMKGSNNISKRTIQQGNKDFCNVKYSRDKNNAKQYCIVPVIPSPTIQECGRRECFESNPQGHDFNNEDKIQDIPEIEILAGCVDWCKIKIGNRKNTIIHSKDMVKNFDTIHNGISVSCKDNVVNVNFDLSEFNRNNLKKNPIYLIKDLKKRVALLERQ